MTRMGGAVNQHVNLQISGAFWASAAIRRLSELLSLHRRINDTLNQVGNFNGIERVKSSINHAVQL